MSAVDETPLPPIPASVISQCILRLFQANSFSQPVHLSPGLGYAIRHIGSPPRTATFAVILFPASSLITAQMYFSVDNAPFSSKNRNILYKFEKCIEIWNRQIAVGELRVEQTRGVVYLQHTLLVRNEANLEAEIADFVNEMLAVFHSYVPCLSSLTESTVQSPASLQPVQTQRVQYFTYSRISSSIEQENTRQK